MTRKVSPGLVEALRLSRLPRRKPTDADRPPPSTFAGPKPRHIAGQLELGDVEHEDELERLEDVYEGMKAEEAIDDAA